MIESACKPVRGTVGTILGFTMLLLGAAGLFGQLQDALNTIWEVKPKPGRGIWAYVQNRFLSLSMVLGVAFLLLVSIMVSAALTTIGSILGNVRTGIVGPIITTLIDLCVISVLFAVIFRYLPDAIIAWHDVWFGAIVTSVLFTIGKLLIGIYLGKAGVGSAYGAAGSLAVLLVWIYYATQIFLFGAELTKAYASHMGSRICPIENAEMAIDKDRTWEGRNTKANLGDNQVSKNIRLAHEEV